MIWKKDTLKPTQPYFVLSTNDFQQEIYQRHGISHFYTFREKKDIPIYAVPDGCIDLFFRYHKNGDMKAYACGTTLKYEQVPWYGDKEVFGVRFIPGFYPAGMQISLRELIGNRCLIVDCFSKDFSLERLASESDFRQRIKTFWQEYMNQVRKEVRPYGKKELLYAVKDYVYRADGIIKISKLADLTGYSERYINRIFAEEMGFSPKIFCKIIQFQRGLEFMNYGAPDKMTDASVYLGYYDQPQFIRDFKKFAGITPYRYLKMIRQENYKEKVHSTAFC